ncbi:hypothetical protein CVT25_004578 [Psilocybe cyanescens]|uniref:Uncharacterized protein n=1 Tax=Psilocybe cyanescens TaxID=93625 RepID=A0A409X2D5_PSICY|nr:hypothetical protein CVT25_004578 [Psilocybe cyanescens]
MLSFGIFTVLVAAVAAVSGQTVYLAGDSTMAKGGGGSGTDGWGQYLAQYVTLSVNNLGVAGRSARSYTEEGRFASLINAVKSGDFVVIEFGHNDGSAGAVDNGRQSAVGTDYSTTATVKSAKYVFISSLLIHDARTKINPVLAPTVGLPSLSTAGHTTSKTRVIHPDRVLPDPEQRMDGWTNGQVSAGPRFVGSDLASRYNSLGQNTVNTYFPNDHTHTSAAGANVVAQAFVKGLACGGSPLSQRLSNSGRQVSDEQIASDTAPFGN